MFVVEMARNTPATDVHILDLVIAGNTGLLRGSAAFPDSVDESFRDFVRPFIQDAIDDANAAGSHSIGENGVSL